MIAEEVAEQIRFRGLVDSFQQCTAAWWERRAQVFEDAMPRPGDFAGRATEAELAVRSARCAEAARLCREHAQLLREAITC